MKVVVLYTRVVGHCPVNCNIIASYDSSDSLVGLSTSWISLLSGNTTGYEATAGGDGSGSINLFVHGLFSGKAMHPCNQETIVAAQKPVKPMRNSST